MDLRTSPAFLKTKPPLRNLAGLPSSSLLGPTCTFLASRLSSYPLRPKKRRLPSAFSYPSRYPPLPNPCVSLFFSCPNNRHPRFGRSFSKLIGISRLHSPSLVHDPPVPNLTIDVNGRCLRDFSSSGLFKALPHKFSRSVPASPVPPWTLLFRFPLFFPPGRERPFNSSKRWFTFPCFSGRL